MRIGGVFNIFGKLLILLSLFLLLPIPFSLYYNDGMERVFMLCAAVGAMIGSALVAAFVAEEDMGFRDGFLVVVLSWLGLAFLGATLEVKAPTVVGDTIHVEVEVTEARVTSRGDRGLVRFANKVVNQRGETVLAYDPLRMLKLK